MIFQFGNYKIDVDREKTRAYYKHFSYVSEGCSCSGCRNYEKAVDFLDHKIIDFFNCLGIDMKKIHEVCVYCANADDTLYYGGFYYLCGEVIEGVSGWKVIDATDDTTLAYYDEDETFSVIEDFHVSFVQTTRQLLDDGVNRPTIILEISADIPWVLDEENDYPKDMTRRMDRL